ncbi:MAG: PQQ-binding-like beta-propeller repeat protein [Chloroflexota bacterium]|nr:PQQ-binding-like beta-propeller repeat protein [Chloroflexota bacterium]MDE2885509.1 PQQ-binding-like beta-propeller repeat protein [Chloroflexota bacterium]
MNQTGAYPGRTGLSPVLVLLTAIVLAVLLAGCAQSRNAATQSWSGVAVTDDSTYVGTREGRIIKLSLDAGLAQVGPYQVPQPDREQGFPALYGTPVVEDGRIYVGTYNGIVLSLDAASLGDARTFEIDGNDLAKGIAGSVIPHNGSLVVAATEDAGEGRLYVIEDSSFIETCRYPARNEPPAGQLWTTPVIQDGIAYFGDQSKRVHAVSITDCRPVWDRPAELGGAVVAPPVIAGGYLYLGAFDRAFYRVSLATGAREKLFEADSWFWGAAVTDGTTLYAPNMDGNVYAYNTASGRVVWTYPADDESEPVLASPVLSDGELVYASDSGVMVVLDAQSGSRKWDRRVGNDVRAPLTAEGRLVFLHSLDETITAIDLDTKQLAWERNLNDVK